MTVTPRLARLSDTAWRLLVVGALIVAAWWLARRLMPVLLPLVVAILLAALLRPFACALERRRFPPTLAAMVAVGTMLVVVGIAVALIVPPFVARIGEVGANAEQGLRQVVHAVAHDLANVSRAETDRLVDRAIAGVQENRGQLAGDVVAGATAVLQVLGSIVLVGFLCFFLVKDARRIGAWFLRFAPAERRDDVAAVGADAWAALGTYIRGVVLVATVDAVLIGLALVIVGVPLVMPLVVLTWVAAFFPIVGAIAAGTVAVLVALVAEGVGAALVVAATITAIQQLEGNFLYPVVVGPRLRLHPIAVLLAVTVGATVGGVAGAFLGVPIATVAAVALHHERRQVAEETPVEPPPASARARPPVAPKEPVGAR